MIEKLLREEDTLLEAYEAADNDEERLRLYEKILAIENIINTELF